MRALESKGEHWVEAANFDLGSSATFRELTRLLPIIIILGSKNSVCSDRELPSVEHIQMLEITRATDHRPNV
jgi:hypothetical protein